MPALGWLAATLVFCLIAAHRPAKAAPTTPETARPPASAESVPDASTKNAAEPNRQAPVYSAASVVNAATNQSGPLAPLGLVSLYGDNLAVVTRAITPDDLRNGQLPTTLIGTGVSVAIDNVAVPIIFVSPKQVNFLIPGNMRTGRRQVRLLTNGRAGPDVEIQIAESSPGLFALENNAVIATRANGTLLTVEEPALPGEVLVLYAVGLGATQPAINGLIIPSAAASISARSQFAVLLNNEPIPDEYVLYAGITPGYAGLYQVNVRLPAETPPNPEIRLRLPGQISPPMLHLNVRASSASVQ